MTNKPGDVIHKLNVALEISKPTFQAISHFYITSVQYKSLNDVNIIIVTQSSPLSSAGITRSSDLQMVEPMLRFFV